MSTSKYYPIWKRLKDDKHVQIVAPRVLHRRIIKAVIKRKDEDLGFKLTESLNYQKWYLHYVVEGNTISFYLSQSKGFIL
jgi:hypothetical protein